MIKTILDNVPYPLSRVPAEYLRHKRYKRIKNKLISGDTKDKVFGIGLSKTGTTSLGVALK
jgi:predicted NAD-dependent protein-ADP-ribosyltransferase YbiA (DUF1768 family)